MEMSYKLDDAGEPVCSCHPVQTFLGGPTCKLLTKSAIFQNPKNDGNILVCTGDEASNSALVSLLFLIQKNLKQKAQVLCNCIYLHMCVYLWLLKLFFTQVTLYILLCRWLFTHLTYYLGYLSISISVDSPHSFYLSYSVLWDCEPIKKKGATETPMK